MWSSPSPLAFYAYHIGYSVDESTLQHMNSTRAEFLMDVADKTKADVKSGTL